MEDVFSALAEGNRSKIIELLYQKDSTLLELSENFEVSPQALSKHIRILEKANIVKKEVQGKYRVLSLNKSSLQSPLEWISYHANLGEDSLEKLETLINKSKKKQQQQQEEATTEAAITTTTAKITPKIKANIRGWVGTKMWYPLSALCCLIDITNNHQHPKHFTI